MKQTSGVKVCSITKTNRPQHIHIRHISDLGGPYQQQRKGAFFNSPVNAVNVSGKPVRKCLIMQMICGPSPTSSAALPSVAQQFQAK